MTCPLGPFCGLLSPAGRAGRPDPRPPPERRDMGPATSVFPTRSRAVIPPLVKQVPPFRAVICPRGALHGDGGVMSWWRAWRLARRITAVERVQARPGDVVVLSLAEEPDFGEIREIRGQVEELLPGRKVVVLAPGQSFAVVRPREPRRVVLDA